MSDVYFTSARVRKNLGLRHKFEKLVSAITLNCVNEGDLVAIKVHFGDDGTTRYIRPMYSRVVVDRVRERGGTPFLTDTLTLYRGPRSSAPTHIELAVRNGFGLAQVGAPIIIADGLRSRDFREVSVSGKHFDSVAIGAAAYDADTLICISHFKGHMAAGFGGTIKNLAMGLATRTQKQRMHADVRPRLTQAQECIGCGECEEICPSQAATVRDGQAWFDHDACIGCAECIVTCPENVIALQWNSSPDALQEKMVEVAVGALAAKKKSGNKVLFFNFCIDVTPDCDCFPFSDTPVVQDVGILASSDPVAIEQASIDLVNAQPGLPGSKIRKATEAGTDKFRDLSPKINWERQLEYAEELGLGSRKYQLIDIDE